MAPPDSDPFRIRGNQGRGDAVFVVVANEVIGVVKLECETENRGDRGQGDVALAPVEPNASDRLAVPLSLAYDAVIDE